MTATVRRRVLIVLAVALVALAAWPLLKANAAVQQSRWEARCTGAGGAVRTLPPELANPLVVQTHQPSYECRGVHGELLSVRR